MLLIYRVFKRYNMTMCSCSNSLTHIHQELINLPNAINHSRIAPDARGRAVLSVSGHNHWLRPTEVRRWGAGGWDGRGWHPGTGRARCDHAEVEAPHCGHCTLGTQTGDTRGSLKKAGIQYKTLDKIKSGLFFSVYLQMWKVNIYSTVLLSLKGSFVQTKRKW